MQTYICFNWKQLNNYIVSVILGIIALNLSHNDIEYIDESAFDNMKHLEILDLNHNKLRNWHSNFFTNSYNVRHVHASNNLISYLPGYILKNFKCGYLKDTSSMKLSFASILTMAAHESFCSLDFSRNRISGVSDNAFANRTKFGYINLSGNKIKSVPPIWLEDFKMVSFNLSENRIKELSFETKKKLHACILCNMTL